MSAQGQGNGIPFNPNAGNVGSTAVTGSPAQLGQAAGYANQANGQGQGLGGGYGLVRQDAGGWSPMAAMGGPGPNTGGPSQMAAFYQRMMQPQPGMPGLPPPMSDPQSAGGIFAPRQGQVPPMVRPGMLPYRQ